MTTNLFPQSVKTNFGCRILDAAQWIQLKRGYWVIVIESRLHHALDGSLDEDRSRVPVKCGAGGGMFRRLVVSVAQAWLEKVRTPKARWSVRRFQQRFGHRDSGPECLAKLAVPFPGACQNEKSASPTRIFHTLNAGSGPGLQEQGFEDCRPRALTRPGVSLSSGYEISRLKLAKILKFLLARLEMTI